MSKDNQHKEKPNIVLICVDQWRGDCLSIDGHPVVHTPYLDLMATKGTRFTRAYTATPSCIPARAGLYTGLSQNTHGRVGYRDGVTWNYETTLAGEFTKNGYQTQAIGKMHVFPERHKMGFENVLLHDDYIHFSRQHCDDPCQVDDYLPWLREQLGREDADLIDHGIDCNSLVARPWDKPEYTHPTNWLTTKAIEFLKNRDKSRPFMLYMSYHRPHPPYDPPQWALDMYLDWIKKDCSNIDVPIGNWSHYFEKYYDDHSPIANGARVKQHILRRARAGYYGHISHIDHQIQRFNEHLREYNLDDNTYICFVSDHGELLGDHNLYRKILPYEGSARIPFIIKGPANGKIPARQTCDHVVELRDVMPTLLKCAGLEIPQSVEGKDLLPAAAGEAKPREWLHGEHTYIDQNMHFITDDKYKYIWHSGTGIEQLFDLENDPTELKDLVIAQEPDLQKWRSRLIEALSGREEGFTDGKKLIAGRPIKACLSHITD